MCVATFLLRNERESLMRNGRFSMMTYALDIKEDDCIKSYEIKRTVYLEMEVTNYENKRRFYKNRL